MSLKSYRDVLAAPGALPLFATLILARIPLCATGMVITLHVVAGLRHGYTAAGLAGAAITVGVAVGAPLMGRALDSYGLRWVMGLTAVAQGVFWLGAWPLPYGALLPAAFVSGVLALPVMSIGRQAIAALVPAAGRRTALSLDSISVELTYMIGPALGVLLCTKVSTGAAMAAIGVTMVLSGIALCVVNPPVRHVDETVAPVARPPRREWVSPQLVGLFVLGIATMFTLVGAELAVVAALRESGQTGWTGVVVALACLASVTGGVINGGLRRGIPPPVLLAVLAGLTIPVGFFGHTWWLLALAWIPSNLACAPAISAMNDQVMRLAPVSVRGEAMGLAASAGTLGLAAGSPVIGAVIDGAGPDLAFVAAGAGGLLLGAVSVALRGFRSRRSQPAVVAGSRPQVDVGAAAAARSWYPVEEGEPACRAP